MLMAVYALCASHCSKPYLSPSSLTEHHCVMCTLTLMETKLCFSGLFQRTLLLGGGLFCFCFLNDFSLPVQFLKKEIEKEKTDSCSHQLST